MQKNEEYTGTVLALGTDGEGIINIDGTTVFVPCCLEGEKVKFKVLSVKGGIAYGKVTEILTPSKHRVNPKCPVFGKCGGCSLQHMSYPAQLTFKGKTVANALYKIGGIQADVPPAEASPNFYAYRNKLVLPVGRLNGENIVGFYAPRSHRIVPVNSCAIQQDWAQKIIDCTLSYMRSYGVIGYDEGSGTGDIRHIVARKIGERYIAALVSVKPVNAKPLADMLNSALGEVTLLLNINAKSTNAVFGDEFITVSGGGFFEAEDMGVKFKAGANTFLQVNDGVRAKLYTRITKEARGAEVAVDLYSGGGMLTALLARACGLAYGIEIVKEASICADELKKLNGLDGKMFNICGKVEDELAGVLAKAKGKKVIVCDPPRKGMERSVVRAIASSGADKVILVSCNPATLARDLGLILGTLKEEGTGLVKSKLPAEYAAANAPYRIEYIQPYDMFPQTAAIETLVVLGKIK